MFREKSLSRAGDASDVVIAHLRPTLPWALMLRNLPILVLTVHDNPADIVATFAEGATDYMTKPFKEAQLRARVRSLLTRVGD